VSNRSLGVGGLSNVREDDTMISVCFFFLCFSLTLMKFLLFVFT